MQKIFCRYIVIMMVLAGLVVSAMNFCLLTIDMKTDAQKRLRNKVAQIAQMVSANDNVSTALEDSLKEDYVTRARSLAYIIKHNPDCLEDGDELERIRQTIDADQIHITNAKGTVIYSTVSAYIGMDYQEYEQTKPFLSLTEGAPEDYFVQDIQPNVMDGTLFQYVAVPRQDEKGIVQLGFDPTRQVEAEEQSELAYVFGYMPIESGETLFAADRETGEILAHTLDDYTGQSVFELGFQEKNLFQYEKGKFMEIDGKKYFCVMKEYDGILIGDGISQKALFRSRGVKMGWIIAFLLIVFGLVLYLVNELLYEKIIRGLHELMDQLGKMERGNADSSVHIHGNPEFEALSTSVNSMIEGLSNSTTRLSRVINTLDIPIAAYEYYENMNRVLATEQLADILRLQAKEANDLYLDKVSFAARLKSYMGKPEQEEEDIYYIEEQNRFLQIIEMKDHDMIFGVVRDVTSEMLSKRAIRQERDFDPLTQIYNRRIFEKRANTILSQENIGITAMVMLDLDKFKGINDSYGHEFGDAYLKLMAGYMKNVESDKVLIGRRSGDEFFMLIHHMDTERQVTKIMKKFYKGVKDEPVHYPDGRIEPMGVSAGLAWYEPEDFENFTQLLKEADDKLYEAKESGRGHFEQ